MIWRYTLIGFIICFVSLAFFGKWYGVLMAIIGVISIIYSVKDEGKSNANTLPSRIYEST